MALTFLPPGAAPPQPCGGCTACCKLISVQSLGTAMEPVVLLPEGRPVESVWQSLEATANAMLGRRKRIV